MKALNSLMASVVFRYNTWRIICKLRRLIRQHQPRLVSITYHQTPSIRNQAGVLEVREATPSIALNDRAVKHRQQSLRNLSKKTCVPFMLPYHARRAYDKDGSIGMANMKHQGVDL